ncbi:membrane protein, partial [Acinetobacter baumannii]
METILGLCIGVGLSAACGFRVFVPLLVMSIATMMGWFEPSKGFEWLALPSVCLALGVATVCEVAAYYIPWVDNALDTVATPAAMIAGTLAT